MTGLTVETTAGPVVGYKDTFPLSEKSDKERVLSGETGTEIPVYKWLGIPYATAVRWTRPTDPTPWTSPLDCFEFREHFPEGPGSLYRIWEAAGIKDRGTWVPQGENGFHINVMSSVQPSTRRLPVMFYIYGGGLNTGASDRLLYDPTNVLRGGAECIYVSGNYRTNVFGFFSHPDLVASDPQNLSGNYGLYDCVKMLEWVQQNIAAFGGDPDNVTVFGESAGACIISHLLVSRRRLFHRAILQSGAPGTLPMKPADVAYGLASDLYLHLCAVAATPEARINALRNLSTKELFDFTLPRTTQQHLNFALETGPHATWSEPTIDKLKRGEWDPWVESVIIMTNEDEASSFTALGNFHGTDALANTVAAFMPPPLQAPLLSYYGSLQDPRVDPQSTGFTDSPVSRFMADVVFDGPSYQLAQVLSSRENYKTNKKLNVYLARLRDKIDTVSDANEIGALGVMHSLDLAFVFDAQILWAPDSHEAKTAAAIVSSWTSFAAKGDPGWTPFTPDAPNWHVFDKDRTYLETAPVPFTTKLISTY